jgi:hypothetical protein
LGAQAAVQKIYGKLVVNETGEWIDWKNVHAMLIYPFFSCRKICGDYCLVVLTILKNMSQLGRLFPMDYPIPLV